MVEFYAFALGQWLQEKSARMLPVFGSLGDVLVIWGFLLMDCVDTEVQASIGQLSPKEYLYKKYQKDREALWNNYGAAIIQKYNVQISF